MIKKIIKLCNDINKLKSKNFEGIGLIIYSDIKELPVVPMNTKNAIYDLPITEYDDILKTLIEISSSNSEFQDGFILLSKKLELTHISQYFSTPIIENLIVKNTFGSRYRTALYGSCLPNVLFTAVISKNYGLIIFENGKEIYVDKQTGN
jgi:DNA integrity scanning protein DisA with diadenylate cyclase activity